jgi:hypothetical protein
MQSLPDEPGTARCCPRTRASPKAAASAADVPEPETPPSWAQLPAARRRRLVAVLGTLVQRTRAEGCDER